MRVEAERVVAEAVGRQEMAAKRAAARAPAGAGRVRQLRAAEEAAGRSRGGGRGAEGGTRRLALAARGVSASGAIRLTSPRAGVLRALYANAGSDRRGRCAALRRRRPRHRLAAGAGVCRRRRRASIAARRWRSCPSARLPAPAAVTAPADGGAADRRRRHRRRGSLLHVWRTPMPACVPASGSASACRSRLGARAAWWCRAARSCSTRSAAPGSTRPETGASSSASASRSPTSSARRPCCGRGRLPGTRVVTRGAAELFGTEFGVGK